MARAVPRFAADGFMGLDRSLGMVDVSIEERIAQARKLSDELRLLNALTSYASLRELIDAYNKTAPVPIDRSLVTLRGADGVCQRAAGLPPWGPPAPNFVTFPLPAAGPLITLETSSGGAGAVHIDFAAPAIADETQFDVMFRLVDSLTSPTNELRTGCFTVTVK